MNGQLLLTSERELQFSVPLVSLSQLYIFVCHFMKLKFPSEILDSRLQNFIILIFISLSINCLLYLIDVEVCPRQDWR